MKEILHINTANDYANDIGAPVYHPHVSVIHYDEMGRIRHTLNRFDVYAIFVQKNFPDQLTYGVGNYAADEDALLAYAPGQIGGKADDGTVEQYNGWVLMFDPEFVYGTEFERNLNNYHYFSYNTNEALKLTADEMAIINHIMSAIRRELKANQPHADRIVQDYILLLADFCNRFYDRQFLKATENKSDILARFQQVLLKYYENGRQYKSGIPSVKYCASELFMSPGYFGDVIRKALGQSPLQYIRGFVVDRSKMLIASGKTIAEVAYSTGFDYPQHFTCVFKKETGMLPSKYLESIKIVK
ncbi:helix-turn-helix protein [Bacteroides zoogleoformans]|uniref:AraC family transcriptional regulator n=1 Tax=Bacteroides zoogleoformans TaxID=28119 RepID=A0ABM6TAF5_9BACE|nr:helix-turn-helix transcriptional regulator [Bacteroides zoogleoformans]AVM53774.1 AraC family transcriptional regulator [Bacteroides zoogleoformans]TWJ18190.1 helix-turn-helix protein [Bacteroides zoogleoformans]